MIIVKSHDLATLLLKARNHFVKGLVVGRLIVIWDSKVEPQEPISFENLLAAPTTEGEPQ
jgi:hypothetical protein